MRRLSIVDKVNYINILIYRFLISNNSINDKCIGYNIQQNVKR